MYVCMYVCMYYVMYVCMYGRQCLIYFQLSYGFNVIYYKSALYLVNHSIHWACIT